MYFLWPQWIGCQCKKLKTSLDKLRIWVKLNESNERESTQHPINNNMQCFFSNYTKKIYIYIDLIAIVHLSIYIYNISSCYFFLWRKATDDILNLDQFKNNEHSNTRTIYCSFIAESFGKCSRMIYTKKMLQITISSKKKFFFSQDKSLFCIQFQMNEKNKQNKQQIK